MTAKMTLEELLNAAGGDLIDPPKFCGCQSVLAQYLTDPFGKRQRESRRDALSSKELSQLQQTLHALEQKNEFIARGTRLNPRVRHLAEGLNKLLSVAKPTADETQSEEAETRVRRRDALRKAVSAFEQIFGSVPSSSETPSAATTKPSNLSHLFAIAGLKRGPIAHEIAWRILEDWGTLDTDQPFQSHVCQVCTPVMAAGSFNGAILWLKVRLYQIDPPHSFEGPLIPDVAQMALTDIDDACLTAFRQVWELTRLGKHFLGVWTLGDAAPLEFLPAKRGIAKESTYPAQVRGPSAQAAMLIALLAATGEPETFKPDQAEPKRALSPEPLSFETAISAEVDTEPSADPIRSRKLKPVGELSKKANAAFEEGLTTIVIRKAQDLKEAPELQQALKQTEESQKAGFQGAPYRGLWVEQVETVEEALLIMLQANRYLRAYQAKVKQEWEENWLPPSTTDKTEQN